MFVQTASKFKCSINIEKDGKVANAKSILSVLSLGTNKGSEISIAADRVDEKEAVVKIIASFKL